LSLSEDEARKKKGVRTQDIWRIQAVSSTANISNNLQRLCLENIASAQALLEIRQGITTRIIIVRSRKKKKNTM
jgi:hypothetical protein